MVKQPTKTTPKVRTNINGLFLVKKMKGISLVKLILFFCKARLPNIKKIKIKKEENKHDKNTCFLDNPFPILDKTIPLIEEFKATYKNE